MSNQQEILCTCGCGGVNGHKEVKNLPGLSALRFRAGTHNSFKTAMLKALSAQPALAKFTSRKDDDLSIALLDAWATTLDVISFYQERFINEGYLRTATERYSVVELAGHISYRPSPGVAAGCFLTFKMNEAPGAPLNATVPAASKVQSVPGQNELPQTFETTDEIETKVEWNAIKLQTKKRIIPVYGSTFMYLEGITTGLQPGDALLMIGAERLDDPKNENWDFRKIKEVTTDATLNRTKVSWERGLGKTVFGNQVDPAKKNFKVYVLKQRAFLFGYNAPDYRIISDSVKSAFIPAGLLGEYYSDKNLGNKVLTRVDTTINFNWGSGSPANGVPADGFSIRWSGVILPGVTGNITFYTTSDDGVRLYVNDQLLINNWTDHGAHEDQGTIWLQAGKFYNIRLEYYENAGSALISLSWSATGLTKQIIPAVCLFNPANTTDWPDYNITAVSGVADTIHLDALYPKITKDSWLVIMKDTYDEVYKVANVVESSRKNFTLASKTMAVQLSGENLVEQFNDHIRDAVIYAQSEELEIADMPVDDPIQNGNVITLEKLMPGLDTGKLICISGKRKRLQITESANKLWFTVDGDDTVSRYLAPYDSLIILQQPEELPGGKYKWTLEDSGGFQGTIEGKSSQWTETGSDEDDETVNEVRSIKSLITAVDPTVIVLDDVLINVFDPSTVTINANVVAATHGETKEETLGSGDGSAVFQQFTLKQTPLTFVSASTASGNETTLQVWVNDILWEEADSLYNASPKDRVYATSINDDGLVTIQFGDGVTGSRLPTGTENVKAKYRVGIGSDGMLNAGQLSMLMSPQLGISAVNNPLDTSGAADKETIDRARENAPLTVLTLDRIVSVKDFEDFSRAFTGIGKALAETLWNGEKQIVHITIGVDDEGTIDTESDLYKNLVTAIADAGHPNINVQVDSYAQLLFSVDARIQVSADHTFEDVQAAVVAALTDTFSFDKRNFGQGVTPAEVIAAIQSVDGVVYTDLEKLNGKNPFGTVNFRLPSLVARWQGNTILPAQLLVIDTNNITISEIQS